MIKIRLKQTYWTPMAINDCHLVKILSEGWNFHRTVVQLKWNYKWNGKKADELGLSWLDHQ